MTNIQDANFHKSDLERSELLDHPQLASEILQALAYGFGWDEVNKQWLRARASVDGHLLVSTSTRKNEPPVIRTNIVTTSPALYMAANENRTQFILYNDTEGELSLRYDGDTAGSVQLIIPKYTLFINDWYKGDITLWTTSGSWQIRLHEIE